MSQLNARVETITPKQAQEMLRHTREFFATQGKPPNWRTMKEHLILKYAEDMSEGRWDLNGEAIKMTDQGHVLDGQHRLEACILADVPFRTLVVRGAQDGMVFDIGSPRTLSGYLRHFGVPYAPTIATALRYVLATTPGGEFRTGLLKKATVQECIGCYRRFDREFLRSADYVARVCGAAPLVPSSILVYAHMMSARQNRELADAFVLGIANGEGMSETSSVFRLRARMIVNAKAKAKLRAPEVVALVIKAWHFYVSGRPCQALVVRDDEGNPSWKVAS